MLDCNHHRKCASAIRSASCGVMSMDDIKRNGFGYYDPTAYEALKKIQREEAKQRKKVQHESKGSKRISSSAEKTGQAN